jgi:hypothetical protein
MGYLASRPTERLGERDGLSLQGSEPSGGRAVLFMASVLLPWRGAAVARSVTSADVVLSWCHSIR